jgi:hypothetical protein
VAGGSQETRIRHRATHRDAAKYRRPLGS